MGINAWFILVLCIRFLWSLIYAEKEKIISKYKVYSLNEEH